MTQQEQKGTRKAPGTEVHEARIVSKDRSLGHEGHETQRQCRGGGGKKVEESTVIWNQFV